ncbi:MAG: hypothetical protein AW09_000419 [Candidatus Accumulibacter phosphatis]|uniref:Uncharacterized protein n=1 Tax=Candidatus Accumulibacter phosphatis TaxID=327160 RepID=A0A080LZG8_9PROT|nr:MAG: hypothetical protein AW09_000419 [Candidatus Accumulibacter phosphatis]
MIEPDLTMHRFGGSAKGQRALRSHAWARGVITLAGGTEIQQTGDRRTRRLVQYRLPVVIELQIECKILAGHLRGMLRAISLQLPATELEGKSVTAPIRRVACGACLLGIQLLGLMVEQ